MIKICNPKKNRWVNWLQILTHTQLRISSFTLLPFTCTTFFHALMVAAHHTGATIMGNHHFRGNNLDATAMCRNATYISAKTWCK